MRGNDDEAGAGRDAGMTTNECDTGMTKRDFTNKKKPSWDGFFSFCDKDMLCCGGKDLLNVVVCVQCIDQFFNLGICFVV